MVATDLGDVGEPDDRPEQVVAAAASAARQGLLTVVLGGDNSLTAPAARGVLGDELGRAGLVTIDAHHDLRDGRTNGSPVRLRSTPVWRGSGSSRWASRTGRTPVPAPTRLRAVG